MTIGEVFTGAGYAVGALVFWWAARGKGWSGRVVAMLMLSGFVPGVIGAKVVQAFMQGVPGAALDPSAGGRAVFGGLIVGWISVEITKKAMGLTRSTGDAFALALPAGEAVGRIGCYFNGCCYGSATDLPWAVYQHGALRHPAQIYAALMAAGLFVAINSTRRLGLYESALFHLYLVLWGVTRFVLEFFRERQPLVLGLDLMQVVSIETVIFGITAFAVLTNSRRKKSDPTP